jgi:hypothetical protein
MTKKYLLAAPGEKLSDSDPQDFFDSIHDIQSSKELHDIIKNEFHDSEYKDFQLFLIDCAFEIAKENDWQIEEIAVGIGDGGGRSKN